MSVALDGDTAIVGSWGDEDPNGDDSGTAYAFERTERGWKQVDKLVPEDGDTEDRFGGAVDIDGNTAVIGAEEDEDPNGFLAGSAYVFERENGSWTRTAKLSHEKEFDHSNVGESVAVSGDTIALGAPDGGAEDLGPGAVHLFERKDGEWTQTSTLKHDETYSFGNVVELEGDTLMIGESFYGSSIEGAPGAVFAYERTDGEWTKTDVLYPEDSGFDMMFGSAVALSGDTVVVGAPRDKDTKWPWSGSAYIFERTDGTWSQQVKLEPGDDGVTDFLGDAVGIADDTVLVGIPLEETPCGDECGVAFVFERVDGTWKEASKLVADDGDSEDFFGTSIAVSGTTALIGAHGDEDPNGDDAGSAYLFDV